MDTIREIFLGSETLQNFMAKITGDVQAQSDVGEVDERKMLEINKRLSRIVMILKLMVGPLLISKS